MVKFRICCMVMLLLIRHSSADFLPMTCSDCFQNERGFSKMCRSSKSDEKSDDQGTHGVCCSPNDSSRSC